MKQQIIYHVDSIRSFIRMAWINRSWLNDQILYKLLFVCLFFFFISDLFVSMLCRGGLSRPSSGFSYTGLDSDRLWSGTIYSSFGISFIIYPCHAYLKMSCAIRRGQLSHWTFVPRGRRRVNAACRMKGRTSSASMQILWPRWFDCCSSWIGSHFDSYKWRGPTLGKTLSSAGHPDSNMNG